jgi:hypothetical protein
LLPLDPFLSIEEERLEQGDRQMKKAKRSDNGGNAVDLVLRPENSAAWSHLSSKTSHNFTVEQFLLSACIDFHCSHSTLL